MMTKTPVKRRTLLLSALAAASAAAALPALAQSATKIVFGYTAVTDFASVFVAAEEGYFKKRSLDVELKFIPLNSTIPAALQSDSLQIGGPTPSVFLQAVDGGLDLVLVAGGGLTSKTITGFGLVARAGSGIKSAQDCVGKKIGVPGLGAFLHVTFRAWLKDSGVDYRKVNFVEAAFPQHADLLRGGSVDAVVSADPFMSRITESGAGYVASYYSTFLPENNQTIVHAAKREWVAKNPAAARAFREALVEAAAFMQQPKNDAKVRAAIGKYIKLPPEVLAKVQVSPPGPVVTDKQLAYWTGLMKEQDMLKTNIDVAKLVAK
ncbi:ABC transporter substrate-binding protein [Variovorax paradoxus]|nr:ABC transporter substrate-binding protein [Variovorax paradoxus]